MKSASHSRCRSSCRRIVLCIAVVASLFFSIGGQQHVTVASASPTIAITNVVAAPGTVQQGSTESLSATITSSGLLKNVIVDLEIFDGSNNRVYQTYQTGVNLSANKAQNFSATWQVPTNQAAGTYMLRIGLFDQWWSTRYAWTNTGPTFQITSSSPTNTPTNTPVPPTATNTNTTVPPTNTSTSTPTATGTPTDALASFRNNKGISHDSNPTAANFDGGGYSYSYEALQAVGVIPGSVVTSNGFAFSWPNVQPGNNDNVLTQGQTISLNGSSSATALGILGAATGGNTSAATTLSYTDNSTQSFTLGLTDWFNAPALGNLTAITTAYRNTTTGPDNRPFHVFSASVPLTAGKTLKSISLPNNGQLHIFALATSTSTNTPTNTPVPPTNTPVPTNTAVPPAATSTNTPGPLALGAWIPGDLWDPSVVDSFTTMVGTAPKIVMWYQDWENSSSFNVGGTMSTYQARGEMPMISWLPDGTDVTPSLDRAIANGDYDAFLHQYAQASAAWGHPFYLRFAWEMNGYWQPYSPGVGGNTSADFVAMWQHVHDLFVHDGATNVRWVWSPNIEYPGSTPFADVYPGDAYVDWQGSSVYDFGAYDQWHTWTSLHDIFAQSYTALAALSSKPMMIAETSSTETGGDKAAWITQGFLSDIPTYFPRVRAVVWFDENKEVDWRVNSSSTSLAAFQKVAASSQYQGQLP